MKKFSLYVLFLFSIQVNAQFDFLRLDRLYNGELIDTTITNNLILYSNYYPYYYQFDAKYPESSQTLLTNCKNFLKNREVKINGNGYLTFRFIIDNEGKMNFVKLSQIDDNYRPKKFNKKAVLTVFEYLKTLDKWKKVRYNNDEKIPISYMSFMSFKIENEKIINIIP